jgi:hypothetical protein
MELVLTTEEAELLQGLLERALVEIREEVHHADLSEFKDGLKAEETLLRTVLSKLLVEE